MKIYHARGRNEVGSIENQINPDLLETIRNLGDFCGDIQRRPGNGIGLAPVIMTKNVVDKLLFSLVKPRKNLTRQHSSGVIQQPI